MYKNILLLFLISCCYQCKEVKNEEPETTVEEEQLVFTDAEIKITKVLTDSISTRALDYKDGVYWYAGSGGNYGSINATTAAVSKGIVRLNEDEPIEFRSISVTDQYTYILSAGSPALLYKIAHATNEVQLIHSETDPDVFYDSMKFWNDEEGIALGDPMLECMTVLKTYDGGAEIGKLRCDLLPDYVAGEAAYAASNSNISIVGDNVWMATGGAMSRIYHSKDRGSSWTVYNTPIIAGGKMTGIYAVDFYDKNIGVVIGGDWENKSKNLYNKAITYDGGKNWKLLSSGSGPGYCSDIQFIPGTNGKQLLAVGSEGIWWSGDTGSNWRQLSNNGFYTVAMQDKTTGYLAGNNKISSFTLETR